MSYELGGENAVPFSTSRADYIVRLSGSEYLAEGRLGNQDLHSDSLVTLWDAIYGKVSSPVIQFTRGTFIVDGVLGIQGAGTVVRGAGEGATLFQATTNLNDHVFEFDTGAYYYNTAFEDFSIWGDKDNQSGGGPYRGIECDITALATTDDDFWYYLIGINRVSIKDMKGTGLYIKTTTGSQIAAEINDVRVTGNGGGGETVDVFIERSWDGFFVNSFISSMELSKSVTTNFFAGNYYAGGGDAKVLRIYGSTNENPSQGCRFVGEFFDNPNNAASADSGCVSIEDFAWNHTFSGCLFGRNSDSSTANLASQLQIIDDATRHKFVGCSWYHADAVSNTFKYAIEEKDNADYNFYSGTISRLDRPVSGTAVYGTGYWSVNGNSDVDGLRVI